MSDYYTAWERLLGAISTGTGKKSPTINDAEGLTIEQQLQVAQTVALISISQELSALNPRNYSGPDEGDAKKRPPRRIR